MRGSARLSISLFLFLSFLCLLPSFVLAQTQASCTFSRFSLSNSTPAGINSYKTVVGTTFSSNSSGSQGFIRYSGGGVSYYSAPGVAYTQFTGRNDNGVNIGVYGNAGSTFEGFLLNGSTFTSIVDPNSGSPYGTRTTGINKSNTIVGYYATSAGVYHGFRRSSNGSYGNLDYPGGQYTQPNGINANGMVVGSFSNGTGEHGFILYQGKWASLDFPNSFGTTQALGVSNAGVILGVYTANEPYTYFIYTSGKFKVIKDANASSFVVNGMGPSGLITGSDTINGAARIFVATCN